MNRLFLLLACVLAAPAFGQKIYKCPGLDGKPIYQQQRCPEGGGREVYIASPRTQRQRAMRAALQRDSAAAVAQRYRVSRRTAQRLAKVEE